MSYADQLWETNGPSASYYPHFRDKPVLKYTKQGSDNSVK